MRNEDAEENTIQEKKLSKSGKKKMGTVVSAGQKDLLELDKGSHIFLGH